MMNCRKICLANIDLIFKCLYLLHDAHEGSHNFFILGVSDAYGVLLLVSRAQVCPLEELLGVSKSEEPGVTLNIVIIDEGCKFVHLGVVVGIYFTPLKACWETHGVRVDGSWVDFLDNPFLVHFLGGVLDVLVFPPGVLSEDLDQVLIVSSGVEISVFILAYFLEFLNCVFFFISRGFVVYIEFLKSRGDFLDWVECLTFHYKI